MPSQRPILIFGETHSDPITRKILLKLLPRLVSLEYKCFFLESNRTLEEQKKDMDQRVEMARMILDGTISDEIINRYLEYYNEKFLNNSLSQFEADFAVRIRLAQSDDALKNFLEVLPKHQMGYQGIDLDSAPTITDFSRLDAERENRDVNMAAAFLKTQQPVFGLIGSRHIAGIQNEILKKMSSSSATEKFSFFSIYSTPLSPLYMFDESFEENMRAKKVMFPLGVSLIDAIGKTEDEVIKIILDEIVIKQQEVTILAPQNRLFPPESNGRCIWQDGYTHSNKKPATAQHSEAEERQNKTRDSVQKDPKSKPGPHFRRPGLS